MKRKKYKLMPIILIIILIIIIQNRSDDDDLEGEPGDLEALENLREGKTNLIKMDDGFWKELES